MTDIISSQSVLIPIIEHDGEPAVNLRDLHSFLEVTTRFNDWAQRMFDYGFVEGVDYVEILLLKNEQQVHGGHNRRDYAVTLDMAKEISMIQRTDRGKQARQYFIEMEKRAQTPGSELDLSSLESISNLLDAGKAALNRAIEAEQRAKVAEARVDVIEKSDGYSIRAFHKQYFPDTPEREFFELLYRKSLLIDQRGSRGRDSRGRLRNGKQHMHPAAAGKPFFHLATHIDSHTGARYHNTQVRPGAPEVSLVSLLEKYGLESNKSQSTILKEITQ